MNAEYVVVLTTLPAEADSRGIGQTIVEEGLAACVNVLPAMESIYRWQGRLEHDSERQLVFKTSRKRVAALRERLRELHPYEVPEFLVLAVLEGDEDYLRWISESTRAAGH